MEGQLLLVSLMDHLKNFLGEELGRVLGVGELLSGARVVSFGQKTLFIGSGRGLQVILKVLEHSGLF